MLYYNYSLIEHSANIVSNSLARVNTAMLVRDIDTVQKFSSSVRPSVCHVPVLYRNSLTYHHTFFSIWQPHHSIFPSTKHFWEILTGSHLREHRIQASYTDFAIFDQYRATCRQETQLSQKDRARLMSFNILLSRPRLLKIIWNNTVE